MTNKQESAPALPKVGEVYDLAPIWRGAQPSRCTIVETGLSTIVAALEPNRARLTFTFDRWREHVEAGRAVRVDDKERGR